MILLVHELEGLLSGYLQVFYDASHLHDFVG